MQAWLAAKKIRTLYIDPGSPWQNGYVESFHGRFRDECLIRMTPEREQQLVERIAFLERENELLRQKLDLVLRKLFGKSSETLEPVADAVKRSGR